MSKIKHWILRFVFKIGKQMQKKPFDVQETRKNFSSLAKTIALMTPMPKNISFTHDKLAGVPTFTTVGPKSKKVILCIHGGGYFVGLDQFGSIYKPFAATLSNICNAKVVMPDYRLAPETPLPGSLDDIYNCYLALLDQGINPEDIFVLGDSAGGGLTLSLLLKLRDDGKPLPRGAIAISPVTDFTFSTKSIESQDDPMFLTKTFYEIRDALVDKKNEKDPYISPLYGDYKGLPPLMLIVGGHEKLLDDTIRVAEKAREEGVDVTLELNEDLFHVYPIFVGMLEEAKEAIVKISYFINEKHRAKKIES